MWDSMIFVFGNVGPLVCVCETNVERVWKIFVCGHACLACFSSFLAQMTYLWSSKESKVEGKNRLLANKNSVFFPYLVM